MRGRTDEELDTGGSDDDGENDPMVCMAIQPFLVSVVLMARRRQECKALIDSGCTRCLMSTAVADSLGVKIRKMLRPLSFEQMDGSLLGGQPATHITERITLEIGPH